MTDGNATLDDFKDKLSTETGLVTITTLRKSGAPLMSVVNAGVLDHPVTGQPVVAFVANGRSARLGHLRRNPFLGVCARREWAWVAVDGDSELIGPDDPYEGFDLDDLPTLLRDIFKAAGGAHDDWDEFDRVMASERRTAVLMSPARIYTNPGS